MSALTTRIKNIEKAILPDCENCIHNQIRKLSDEELDRRISDLEKREYATSSLEELEAKVKEIEAIIRTKKGRYGGGSKELFEKLTNEES